MLAKFCPSCSTPLKPDALSCPTCGHMLVSHDTDTASPSRFSRYRHLKLSLLIASGLALAGLALLYSLCFFCPEGQKNNRSQALAQSIGNQEKLFFSERFASPEGISLYRDMIDHELVVAEERGTSDLLGDRLPDAAEEVTARHLSEAYVRDEFNADMRYRNHTLLVDAYIETIQSDISSAPCIVMRGKDTHHDVQACLRDAPNVVQDLSFLRAGSRQKMLCRGDGYVMPSALLGDCVPQVSVFRQRARELKRSCITHVTRGQLFTRLRDTSHPLHHTKPLMMMLRAEYGVTMLPECRHGWSALCEHSLQNTRDEQINEWLSTLFPVMM